MTQVVLFHHVLGLTDGIRSLAALLAADGRHTVHTPDLYDGRTFDSIDEGIAFGDAIDPETIDERIEAALEGLSDAVVFAGISWGVMPAQRLAQTRPGALGALLYEACVSLTAPWSFGPWPAGVRAQIHGRDADPFFAGEGDLDAARELVAAAGPETAELFVYPGAAHLSLDSSLPVYDPEFADLVVGRSVEFLDSLAGRAGAEPSRAS